MAATPRPYRPKELRTLRLVLDERWPLLADDEACYWLARYRASRSPYSRVRSHVVRAQLDAVIALALQLGLRRGEILSLTAPRAHYENEYVVVGNWREDDHRCVPFTTGARAALQRWCDIHHWLGSAAGGLWLNVHAGPTVHLAMKPETFHRLLATYVGPGWELRRLRDTCAVLWVRSGLPLEHLRQLLGLNRIDGVLPYARLVRGSLTGEMAGRDEFFAGLSEPPVTSFSAA